MLDLASRCVEGTARALSSVLAAIGVVLVATACEDRQGADAQARTTDVSAVSEVMSGPTVDAAAESITTQDLAADIQVIASDSFGGRAPASHGEVKTIQFLREEFRELGLQPGNGDSWFQEVPLVSITVEDADSLRVTGQAGTQAFAYGDDYMAWTKRVVDQVDLDESELVFVGYGVVAPEYGWNDYEGLDVEGKTVVMLVNDPGFATGDTTLFTGSTMTYYGRWTYKYEEAARQGAAAAFVIHESEPAGYPWEVVRGSWSGPQFSLVAEDDNMSRVQVEGWLTSETARTLFEQAGLDYDSLSARAATREFEAVPMGLTATVGLTNSIRRTATNNVLAVLPGAERADEYVIYMAHWDHLGRDTTLDGDQIYNGAHDNASGTAGLLELAEAFVSLPERPGRSLLFLAVGAEEKGLLGSAWYATHPAVPLDRTVAAINMDGLNIWGPTNDIIVIGLGKSELDNYVAAAAEIQDRVVRPDAEPEKGFYYRSDHFELARQGVPALYTDAGIDNVEHGEEWGRARKDEYTAEDYHMPSDEFDASWDLGGAVNDLRLLFRVGYALSNSSGFPNWNEGTEFRAARDSTMARANAETD